MRDLGLTSKYVSVKDFGAKGDNSTNDSAAFTAAVSGSATPVFVPEGTYVLTSFPTGRFYGVGVLKVGSTTVALDPSTAQRVNTPLTGGIGDPIRLNTVVGQTAAASLTASSGQGANVAVGHNALTTSTNGSRNTALGSGTMQFSGSSSMSKNVAVGTDAQYASVWNDSNTFVGSNAGKWTGDTDPMTHMHDFFNGSGSAQLYSIDSRWSTLRTDIVGSASSPANLPSAYTDNQQNVGVGRNTLLHAVKAIDSVAVGYNSLAHGYNVTGATAVGSSAMRDGINVDFATAVGFQSQQQNASGIGNTSLGYNALQANTHSRYNVAVGYSAMESLNGGLSAPDTGNSGARRNVAIGPQAMADSTSGSFNVAVGSVALRNCTSSNNIAVGGAALNAVTSGTANVAVGHSALDSITTQSYNTAVGFEAGKYTSASAGTPSTGSGSNTTRSYATAIGYRAPIIGDSVVQLGTATADLRCYDTSISGTSDLRDKTDVRDATLGLDFVNRVRPVEYRWDYRIAYEQEGVPRDGRFKGKRYHTGVIAQEIKQLIDETGQDFGGYKDTKVNGGEDVLAMNYAEFVGPLIKAVQELSARVVDLESQIAGG
ncbi:tail fiber domain-containing protein [Streptomyces sp. NPDC002754]